VPDRPIRVVIADDHAVVLGGLASLLALESDLAVVAACSNGETAIEAVRAHGVDVLLLDLNMRLDGLAVMRALIKEGICPRVVLLTRRSTMIRPWRPCASASAA
jgi:DNA-binding NarL/FixJ family response regulator